MSPRKAKAAPVQQTFVAELEQEAANAVADPEGLAGWEAEHVSRLLIVAAHRLRALTAEVEHLRQEVARLDARGNVVSDVNAPPPVRRPRKPRAEQAAVPGTEAGGQTP